MTALPDKPTSPPNRRKANLRQVIGIVVSGFFMVGRDRDYGPDAPKVSPAQVVIVAVIGAALFVGGLITLVSFITR